MFSKLGKPTPTALHSAADNALEAARAEVDRAADLLGQAHDLAHDLADSLIESANTLYVRAEEHRNSGREASRKRSALPDF